MSTLVYVCLSARLCLSMCIFVQVHVYSQIYVCVFGRGRAFLDAYSCFRAPA